MANRHIKEQTKYPRNNVLIKVGGMGGVGVGIAAKTWPSFENQLVKKIKLEKILNKC